MLLSRTDIVSVAKISQIACLGVAEQGVAYSDAVSQEKFPLGRGMEAPGRCSCSKVLI